LPDLLEESFFISQNMIVTGVDEVGRGPLAGPVVAAAVILNYNNIPEHINDSKKLSAKRREEIAKQIKNTSLYGIGMASVEEIDEINILQASKLAMERAVFALSVMPQAILVDGIHAPDFSHNKLNSGTVIKTIKKGDTISFSIAAASIIAKVERDKIMKDLSTHYPEFGWDRNSGYGTKEHNLALVENGITKHHRRSFSPVKKLTKTY
jgi:ribonuclease HII